MILASDLAVFPVMFARALGGDFISTDRKLLPDPAAMEKGLAVLADLFQAGALPRSYVNTRNDDMVTWLQQGRAAFGVLPFARFAQLNNPEQSSVPGKIKAVAFPGSTTLPAGTGMAAVVEILGHGDPGELDRQGAVLELHQGGLQQGGERWARRATATARSASRPMPIRISPRRSRWRRSNRPSWPRPARPSRPSPRRCAPRRPSSRRSRWQSSAANRRREAVAAIQERVTPLLPA